MKKLIIILFIVSLLFIIKNDNSVIIPQNAIRFRIIANSDTIEDQNLKNIIKNRLLNEILPDISTAKNKNESQMIIQNSIPKINNILDSYNINYNVNFGQNYFPEKNYKGINYSKGNYESLVITINKGMGKNWWCVLYPPLCLIDTQSTTDNITYKSLVKEIINKYSHNI